MAERHGFPRLETERLILRQMTMDNLDFHFNHCSVKEREWDESGRKAAETR
jgi:hypothetical protein